MNIIIPMSGLGSRFFNAGYTIPKAFIEIEGKPIIQHVVDRFDPDDNFIFVVNELHCEKFGIHKVLEKIAKNSTVHIVDQSFNLGPVMAVLQILDYINDDDEDFIVNYCDFSWRWDYKHFKEFIKKDNPDGCIITYQGFHPHLLGPNYYASTRCEDDTVLEIKEKFSFTDNKMDCPQSSGTYYFKTGEYIKKYFNAIYDDVNTLNGEYYVSLVYNYMIQDNKKIKIYDIPYFMQWGTPQDLEEYIYWKEIFFDTK